jgi:replicative DNA helicase
MKPTAGNSALKLMTNKRPNVLVEGGKLPPQDIKSEELVLACLLIDKQALGKVQEFLKPEYFYSDQHAQIYQAILDLKEQFKPIDVGTLKIQLKKAGFLEIIGGPEYLMWLTTQVSTAANLEHYSRGVQEQYLRRALYERLINFATMAYDETADIFETIESVEQEIFNINNNELQLTSVKNGVQLAGEFLQELYRRSQIESGLTGLPSGFTSVDRYTHGWQNSDLIIIAARPGMGKTSWFLSNVRALIVDFNIPTAIFSLEMSSMQLIQRLYSIDTTITGEVMRTGKLNKTQWNVTNSSKIASPNLYIDDTAGLRISQLVGRVRRLVSQRGVKILFVDYLQLMSLESGDKSNREQEISKISRALKGIAKECNIPVIALSQLSRGVETRGGDKRPQLSDLRDSGAIEQDADIVMFLYRPEYYKISVDEENLSTAGMAENIIAKHRNGATGTVKLKFAAQYTKFMDLEDMNTQHSTWNPDKTEKPDNIDKDEPGF